MLVRPHLGVGAAGADEEEVVEPLVHEPIDQFLDLRAQRHGAGQLLEEFRLVETEHLASFRECLRPAPF
nr:hypothetical protein GCM10020093_037510 [Planobispora longispora]